MANNSTIFVGTLGQGVWRSTDGGDNWLRAREGINNESAVRALAVHPKDSSIIYAGTGTGVFRTENTGDTWEKLDSPMNQIPIWTLAIDPVDPDIIFAGTRPGALFRSKDGGLKWEKLSVQIAEWCINVEVPRITALVVDPVNHNNIWAGIEVDGVRYSRDGGDTWDAVTEGITDPDIHDIGIYAGTPKTLLTITPREVFSSTDDGVTWDPLDASSKVSIPYCRTVAVSKNDPQVVYMGNGDSPFGNSGALHRSRDRGMSWETLPFPEAPNGTLWEIATHHSDPNFLMTCSVNGQVFLSYDAGDSWTKLSKYFGEVHALAAVPS